MFLRSILVGCVVVLAGAFVANASASQLIARNATHVRLAVNSAGVALITFKERGKKGKVRHILARGAINARPPIPDGKQVKFKIDYAGGWGFYHKRQYWKHFHNVCGPYEGPDLAWFVAACTMPDGSHWALQAWQRMLPNFGTKASASRSARELRLSHWNTDLPILTINTDWSYHGQWDHLWGTFTYLNNPVYGFSHTRSGNPLDDWGRNVYVDTFNSGYGKGWKRENSFLTHEPTGGFCYGFSPHRKPSTVTGKGTKYRATVSGPGVTPDVFWTGPAPGPFDEILDDQANAQQEQDLGNDPYCEIN
jgi:hypothetical protein